MCPRPPELNSEELVAARANVSKFEPPHGWGSDKRANESLTTVELHSLIEWLRDRNANLSVAPNTEKYMRALDHIIELQIQLGESIAKNKRLGVGGCRFNCRTAKENFLAGWELGQGYTGEYSLGESEREAIYHEWKRIKTPTRPRVSGQLVKGIPGEGDGIG